MRQRSAFTFIEVMIVVAILAILAGIVYPMVIGLGDAASATVMKATVRHIRQKIALHSALGDVPMTREGFPKDIHPDWFNSGHIPLHAWTGRPMKLQVVNGGKTAPEPNNQSYIVQPDGDAAGHTAWYNASNGSFCALVPKIGTAAEIRGLFNLVNSIDPE